MQWYYLDANQQQVPADESELGDLLQSGTVSADTMLWNESMADWESARDLFPDWFPAEVTVEATAAAPALRAPALVNKGRTVGLVKRPRTGAEATDGSSSQKLSPSSPSGARTQRTTGASGSTTQRTTGGSRRAREGREEGEAADLVRDVAGIIGHHPGWTKFAGVGFIIFGVLLCLTVAGALVGWLPIWMGVVIFKIAGAAERGAHFGRREDLEEILSRVAGFHKLFGIYFIVSAVVSIVVTVLYAAMVMALITQLNQQSAGGMPGALPPVPEMPAEPAAVPATEPEPAPAAPTEAAPAAK